MESEISSAYRTTCTALAVDVLKTCATKRVSTWNYGSVTDNHYAYWAMCRLWRRLRRWGNPYLPHYKSPTALSHMHHLTCGISSLLHSVNLILFTLLLLHLILRISPYLSHHLHSHHPSLPLPFTPDLKLISFTNPFPPYSHSYSFRTDFTDLNLYWIKGALALFVLVSGCVC